MKKRQAIYNPEADRRYREKLTPEQKAEVNRRKAFNGTKNFIEKERYTPEEFEEIKRLIELKMKCELYS